MFSPPAHAHDDCLAAGSILGIWRVGELIACGMRTDTYAAQPADSIGNPRWDYAVKTLSSRGTETSARTGAKRLTASVAASIVTHPHLVSIVDASTTSTRPYVVMPRLRGTPLDEKLAAIPNLTLPVVLWWTRQVSEAIDALHVNRFVHGDVHPGHVWIDATGKTTLIDLGSATPIHESMPTTARGTAPFSAPELKSGKSTALAAMDVYSLGQLLWHSMLRLPPQPSRSLEAVAELVESMIAGDHASRPSSAVVVQRLLALELQSLGQHIVPTTRRRAA